MQNNNTSDIAYLGCGSDPIPINIINNITKESSFKCPEPELYTDCEGIIYVFDCTGTRYGFRIKKYKK